MLKETRFLITSSCLVLFVTAQTLAATVAYAAPLFENPVQPTSYVSGGSGNRGLSNLSWGPGGWAGQNGFNSIGQMTGGLTGTGNAGGNIGGLGNAIGGVVGLLSMLASISGLLQGAFGGQALPTNRTTQALMALANADVLGQGGALGNILGLVNGLSGFGGGLLPFGGTNAFTSAAASRLGEITSGVPGTENGNLACAWVVNDIFRSVTGSTIVGSGGNPLSVYDTVRAMERNSQMFTEVSQAQAIASGRDFVAAWNPAWGGEASHIVYGRGNQGIGNSSGSRSIATQGIGGQHARYFIIN